MCLLLQYRWPVPASDTDAMPATPIVILNASTAGHLQWASALLPQVLADAEARRLQRETTGSAVLGVPTGLAHLDHLLGGFTQGLYLLAGAPGMGKTTLALQLAAVATADVPCRRHLRARLR